MKSFNKQSGFTLIELLVYVAILVVAVTVVAMFTVDIINSNRAEQGNRNTQQNARFVIERLQYETRWANSIDTPFQSDEIILQTPGGTVRFYLGTGGAGQTAMFIERGGFSKQLTTDQVEVTDFSLTTMDPPDTPPSVAVDLAIEDLQASVNSNTDISTIITVRKN